MSNLRNRNNDPFDHPFFDGHHTNFQRTQRRTVGAVIGLGLLTILLNVLFWGGLIALGFYAVNKFS